MKKIIIAIICFALGFVAGAFWAKQQVPSVSANQPLSAGEVVQKTLPTAEPVQEASPTEKEPAKEEQEPIFPLPSAVWEEVPCEDLSLPENTHQDLICKTRENAECAIFQNGRPFFCQETSSDGKKTYQSNQWGSSVTYSRYLPDGKMASLYYFAYGELKREEEHNYGKNLISRIWFDDHQTRIYQSNTQGRTLNKFYFRPDQPYIQYPDGNDMGEINGQWHREGDKFFIDGQFLYELQPRISVPDICALFDGACGTVPTQP